MKKNKFLFLMLISSLLWGQNPEILQGAWINSDEHGIQTVLLFQDDYYSSTIYDSDTFFETKGGPYQIENNQIIVNEEFNTTERELKTLKINFTLENKVLKFNEKPYRRIDDSNADLAGVWQISGRLTDGEIKSIHYSGTRKTLKVLTGTRFQWFAIDPTGNKFFGTGGGTYTFENGKYTETIEFFSKNPSRIGAVLTFDDSLKGKEWHHSGLSSMGNPIYEVWKRVKDF